MKISIIVPVYKVEKELERCIESLIHQTYDNLQIILVDDGSPDRCPEICDHYALSDGRIEVIHKKNGGLSDARNCGLEQAKGDYVLFVDSDDTIDKDACERFVECLKQASVDIVVGECREVHSRGMFFQAHTNLYPGTIYSAKEYMISAISAGQFYCPAWLNLYRKEFLIQNKLKFEFGILHEDMEWTPKAFLCKPTVSYLQGAFYNYIIRDGSITQSKNYEKNIKDSMWIYQKWLDDFTQVTDAELKKHYIHF